MTASISQRKRRIEESCGGLATAKVHSSNGPGLVYVIRCKECVRSYANPPPGKGSGRWSTLRSGQVNDYTTALDRWVLHLAKAHPEAQAPCLAILPEARARRQSRLAVEAAVLDVAVGPRITARVVPLCPT